MITTKDLINGNRNNIKLRNERISNQMTKFSLENPILDDFYYTTFIKFRKTLLFGLGLKVSKYFRDRKKLKLKKKIEKFRIRSVIFHHMRDFNDPNNTSIFETNINGELIRTTDRKLVKIMN